jgi:cytokinin dehydrogenase
MSSGKGQWSGADAMALATDHGVFVHRDPDSRRRAGHDFGGIERGDPWGVVAPRDTAELERLVRFAAARQLSLTPRGRGYSQSGQSLAPGGVTIDCTRLDRIDPVDGDQRSVRCEAGARWREVVSATLAQGLLPVVLPLNLDMSVGGLLAVGGIGANSHRHGPAVVHAIDLQVVTATDGLVRCDRAVNADLFDSVLAGLGRCGVLAHARLALRPAPRRVRTFHLLYGDLQGWLADQRELVQQRRADYLEGLCWASAKGTRSDHMGRRPFAHWLYGLQLGIEYSGEPPEPSDALAGLEPWRIVHVQDDDLVTHIDRYHPRFDGMRRSGAWEQLHPWLECLLPVSRLPELLPEVLDALPPMLGDGHRVVWMARPGVPSYFAMPDAEEVACLAILPTGVAEGERDLVLQTFRQIDHSLRAAGGKRYPSGWLGPMQEEDWREHHGARYDAWRRAKRRFDPEGVFRSAMFPHP